MPDLRGFREAVKRHRRAVGHTQQQLARSIGLHPDVLSHKLNGRDNAVLTAPDVVGIVMTLADWGALVTREDVYALLDLVEVPPHAIPDAAWSQPPLATLRVDHDDAVITRAAGYPSVRTRAVTHPRVMVVDVAAAPQRIRVTPAPLPAPATPLIGRDRERGGGGGGSGIPASHPHRHRRHRKDQAGPADGPRSRG
jgi:hypothetical protein